ncbi:PhzF family phenazine biosynthesis protein [Bacillus fonticola]|uniref:PhzF family phenazine biosynthesis protein n=1 Tax=Bacillus fonticola TaxID=2728853 RepID=UPI001473938D|nr:PhzF family phenazine biosynthesis protein [Bacillus fonticola]
MRRYSMVTFDVFSPRAFGGNQLAIFPEADELSTDDMQTLAKEINLSETVFCFPPHSEKNTAKLRIFTPGKELPVAGHPTIGTAVYFAELHGIQEGESIEFIFEEGVGPIHVDVNRQHGKLIARMHQPIPHRTNLTPIGEEAALLGLDAGQLHPSIPPTGLSAGVPFLYIPLLDREALASIQFRRDVWESRYAKFEETSHIFAFAMDEKEPTRIHSRMFAPAMGISEDPATGIASGPLGVFVAENFFAETASSVHLVSIQGADLGRRSVIQIDLKREGGTWTDVSIAGTAVQVGEGAFFWEKK